MNAKLFPALVVLLLVGCGAVAQTPRSLGFLEPAESSTTRAHQAAALAFAKSKTQVLTLRPANDGGWQDAAGTRHALEECEVIWYHDGDGRASGETFTAGDRADLREYLEGGGVLLLSGAAGRLLNELAIEPTPLRVLGVSEAAFVSGIRVPASLRTHPAFAGLDTTKPVFLTTRGVNALADFYGTAGPHGELLADGNGAGERPLVEYRVGAGRVIFVGWRLADFTTTDDVYRPNLERLFVNLLSYLAGQNQNRARLVAPPGKSHYERQMGVPFLLADRPVTFAAPVAGEKTAVVVDNGVHEMAVTGATVRVTAWALTLTQREKPVTSFMAKRRAEQDEMDRLDRERIGERRVLQPDARLLPAPLQPLRPGQPDQSVLLGYSPFMAPGNGTGDVTGPVYAPLEDGGFRIVQGTRRFNRPIVHGQNRIWTGDVPIFRMDTVTGNGSYAKDERVFPLWPRPDAQIGNVNPCLGTLRLGLPGPGGKTNWLDEQSGITTTFRPGYTEYRLAGARVTMAPALDFHGFVCRIEFDRDTPLLWRYGGIWWQAAEANSNRVEFAAGVARMTEPRLPNGLVLVGWDGAGEGRAVAAAFGQQAEFCASRPRRLYHVVAAWGVTRHDEARVRSTLARLDTPSAAAWPQARDVLKQSWFEGYIGRALEPEKHFQQLLVDPAAQWHRTCEHWDERRAEFQIRTPDAHLNALINWARCISEYHRQGPGLVLGGQIWQMYSHISTGWYGKQWAGDHAALEECLRFYGALQGNDGFIRWISPSLVAFNAENNTPYWVDQVWRHYTWTGDQQFVRDLWPGVRKAVAWMRARNDPDGDGLFRDAYEYWNCDSNGKGPKSAVPSAMSWAMLDRAARMARVVGDSAAATEYRTLAEKTRTAIFRELWNEREGRLGCIGSDGLWRGHPQTWEEYLAINAGLLEVDQGRRAMRWLAAHYGFEPQPGVRLLACSDWWPIRWSCQWVPTGDTCLAALAGMKCGDIDIWWPYLRTVVGSAFHSEFPGINMGISNAGAGGGDREDVDSDDPHLHVVVRGLFGLEPALHEGRLEICPAFPSAWRKASLRMPEVSYEWQRDGDRATFHIRTAKPLVKRVRAGLGGEEVVTPVETESRVTLKYGPAAPPLEPIQNATILADRQPPSLPRPLTEAERHRLLLFDLASICNLTSEEFTATKFTFDYADGPSPLSRWWGNPTLTQPTAPRALVASNGVVFLTAGRPRDGLGAAPKNLLALASWPPNPLPGGVVIPVGTRCERLWLLLQSYVHPMKNYLPNGEVVLHYAGGETAVTSLIPPFNLDCYFQHFSREGLPVPLGQLGAFPADWTPIHRGLAGAHADALEIACDPARALESVELRATCSEAVIGLAGMTALTASTTSASAGNGQPAMGERKGDVLVEAESFRQLGGWVMDQQSMDQMGSPYILAHGLGVPVADATTTVEFPKAGTYHLWVRTRDWVAPWKTPETPVEMRAVGTPGRFQIVLDGRPVATTFGTEGADWHWQDGGRVEIPQKSATLALHDLTGFAGRCDALFFTAAEAAPPNDAATLAPLRRKLRGLPEVPLDWGEYDLVVVGGGAAGCCAAVSAARLGCKVALIHDRPVLGGNNSSEVRVGLSGLIHQAPYPHLGDLVDEWGSVGHWSLYQAKQAPDLPRSKEVLAIIEAHPEKKVHNAGPAANYEDEKKLAVVQAEKNLTLFLSTRANGVVMDGPRIGAVIAEGLQAGIRGKLRARIVADCTGDGVIGALAGADYAYGRESKAEYGEDTAPSEKDEMVMGTSVQWYAQAETKPSAFPECPWALPFNEKTCLKTTRGDWDWETGALRNHITEIERIRDYGLRVVFGNWAVLKNHPRFKKEFARQRLQWVAYIGGKRESRRLLGDVLLRQQDVVEARPFPDASVTTTWTIDLHYPKENLCACEAFQSEARHIKIQPYPIPYRCFYSRNIENLMMAGRNISVTHVALGTVRVMRTGGMMGEVVGMAASLCTQHHTTPRGIYENHLDSLKALMQRGVGLAGLRAYP
jgi:hypothetical protein